MHPPLFIRILSGVFKLTVACHTDSRLMKPFLFLLLIFNQLQDVNGLLPHFATSTFTFSSC